MIMKEKGGSIIGDDLLYESLTIPYRVGAKGKDRSYIPDFYDMRCETVYEVKPRSRVNTRTNVMKADSARKHLGKLGIQYTIVDERDIPKISAKQARLIPGVQISKRRKRRR